MRNLPAKRALEILRALEAVPKQIDPSSHKIIR